MIPNQAELEEYYIVQRFSQEYIASFCDIPRSKVQSLMKEYDIRSRSLSEAGKGQTYTEETKRKISATETGKIVSNESKLKMSESSKGKIASEETRRKMSKSHKGFKHTEESIEKMCDRIVTDETKNKMKGKNNPNWKGGISFGEYCPAFNEEIKEYIRDKYNRKCFNCGMEEDNDRKLDVHHVDFNKMQGCNEHEWRLIPLCKSCHASATNNREGSERHYRIVLECL